MTGTYCDTCGARFSRRTTTREHPYHYKESGLSNVYLTGVVSLSCPNGHPGFHEFSRLGELLDLLATILLEKNDGLTGEEVRFLRKHAGLSGIEFAARLQIDPSSLSRIESGAQALGSSTDKLARAIALAEMEEAKKEDLRKLLATDRYLKKPRRQTRLLTLTRGRWKEAKVA